MASPFPYSVTAAQVGTYFVGQYYQVFQQQPDLVHQFYSEASSMIRVDGNTRETASAMLQIHNLVLSLSYTAIEIKTAHSVESWNGGVLILVSGSVQLKDFSDRRKFVQTFFLAPQEKGYFVLNDVFQFIEDDFVHQHPPASLAQSNLDSRSHDPSSIPEPVPKYMLQSETQTGDFVDSPEVENNTQVDKYDFHALQLQQVPEAENILEENHAEESNGSLNNLVNTVQDPLPPIEEPFSEPQKHTYASILRVPKGVSASSVAPQPSFNHNTAQTSEWHHAPQPTAPQSTASSVAYERPRSETAEISIVEDEDEIRSVYVRNLPSTVSSLEIEEEFKNFGVLKPDGVVIRALKDADICYAFVEFDDSFGVQNAIKASPIQLAGRQIYIEERRAKSINSFRGGRRGRGRGSYQTDSYASRGRFGGRSFGRGNGEYSRGRANGFHRQDRGFSGNQVSRNGHSHDHTSLE